MGAARRNRDTGQWEDAYRSGRSDLALVRSLRDRRISVRTLIVHDDLGLWKEVTAYPALPDMQRHRPARCTRVGLAASLSVSGEENHDGRC